MVASSINAARLIREKSEIRQIPQNDINLFQKLLKGTVCIGLSMGEFDSYTFRHRKDKASEVLASGAFLLLVSKIKQD